MGTSVNQRSPKTTGWTSVGRCYSKDTLSVERTVSEIWRAVTSQDAALMTQLGSSVVSGCLKASLDNPNKAQAIERIREISSLKNNSIIGEFAKRTLLVKAAGGFPDESATMVLFRQLTAYYVSRDIPGFVGENFRCKTITQLREFKDKVTSAVAEKVRKIERQERLTLRNWENAFPILVSKLREP